ncbi:hypothetical protein ECG_05755 [Echinococcus granulosus]|nr:hypothetical protein ECG_05755 [Echinococcus granulosus]
MASNETSGLETRTWNLLRDQMMDGVQSVDELVYESFCLGCQVLFSDTNESFNGGHFGEDGQTFTTTTTTLPEAVVSFTAKLLKEKAETDSNGVEMSYSTVLSEANRTEGSSPEHESVTVNNSAIHLLWH